MSTNPTLVAPQRTTKRTKAPNPLAAGLPDPRPITGYTTAWDMIGDRLRIIVTLDQPCIIRQPKWGVVDYRSGDYFGAINLEVLSNASFFLDFHESVPETTGFIEVPYQDVQVQNFQGGFVRPGAKWFRY